MRRFGQQGSLRHGVGVRGTASKTTLATGRPGTDADDHTPSAWTAASGVLAFGVIASGRAPCSRSRGSAIIGRKLLIVSGHWWEWMTVVGTRPFVGLVHVGRQEGDGLSYSAPSRRAATAHPYRQAPAAFATAAEPTLRSGHMR